MEILSFFTPEERADIDVALSQLSSWIRLDKMFLLWREFVDDVQNGYTESDIEYTNDLSVRDLISSVVAAVPPATATKIKEYIRPIDERFLSATTPNDRAIGMGSSHWWFRMPKVLTGDLRDDLQRRGLLG